MLQTDLTFLISVFPIAFMFHDFEEIIFFKSWLTNNKNLLRSKFPRISKRILPNMEKLSTEAFSLAVAEEFFLLSIITYTSIAWKNYFLWFAIFMAFSIHLIGHLIQWMIYRRYLPSIVTSLICLPYCIYTFYSFLSTGIMSTYQVVVWTMIGLVIMILNLLLAHTMAMLFDRWHGKANS